MTTGDEDKDDADLYPIGMDDEDGMTTIPTVIVEEEPGTVALKPAAEPKSRKKGMLAMDGLDVDAEGDLYDGSDDDKEEEDVGGGWDDAYEQEV
jgi:transcription factor IIIB 90 kDa subunit